MPGKLITFEGIDFSGKTTIINKLKKYTKENKIDIEYLREPGGDTVAEALREVLLKDYKDKFYENTELLVYSASRSQLIDSRIKPLLEKGKSIIIDRFYDSTTAYQGYGRGLNIEHIKQINLIATRGIKPIRTFLFDLEPEIAINRALEVKKDRIERDGLVFFKRVRQGYLEIAKKESDRFFIIDATKSKEEVYNEVVTEIGKIINYMMT